MTQHGFLTVICCMVLAGCGSTRSVTTPTQTPTTPPASLASCASWATLQRGTGVPTEVGSVATQRQALFNAGGGIKVVGSKYYVAYFPAGYAGSTRRRVLVTLHGTGGSPEAQWNDWNATMRSRNWALLAVKYLDDATGTYDDDQAIYNNIKLMVDDVRASCDLGSSASFFLEGFSRGSAQAFPVTYLDLKDRRFFKATGNNSGAWPPSAPLVPTLAAIVARQETTALSGSRFWMYCGELDMEPGFPMCDALENARVFVSTYGGTVAALFRDPTGRHGGLTSNATAIAQMFSYFEGL